MSRRTEGRAIPTGPLLDSSGVLPRAGTEKVGHSVQKDYAQRCVTRYALGMSETDTPENYPGVTPDTPADEVATLPATALPAEVAPSTAGKSPKVDGRTRLARVFRRTREHVVESLGGKDNISAQQAVTIQQLAEAEALRAGIFACATRGEPIDIGQYAALATVSQRCLKLLGMKRVAKNVQGLRDYMQERANA